MLTTSKKTKPIIIGVIDDDEIFHFAMRKNLDQYDIPKKLLFFSNGSEALEYFKTNVSKLKKLPDLLFLDIKMPVMDGFQFMEAFSKLKPSLKKDTRIHMVTASTNRDDIKRTKALSEVSEYVLKPLKNNDLKTLLTGSLPGVA